MSPLSTHTRSATGARGDHGHGAARARGRVAGAVGGDRARTGGSSPARRGAGFPLTRRRPAYPRTGVRTCGWFLLGATLGAAACILAVLIAGVIA